MKKNFLFKQIIPASVYWIFIAGIITVCQIPVSGAANQSQQSLGSTKNITDLSGDPINNLLEEAPNRENISAQIEELREEMHRKPNDINIKSAYARKLFQLGNFDESKKIIDTIPQKNDVIYLLAQIEYVKGNYKEAEKLYNILNKSSSKDYKLKAQTGLLYTYYQTNQFKNAKNLTAGLEKKIDEPLKKMMTGFKNKKPYMINWNNNSEVRIPFIADEPLPVIAMEVNGKKINAIIDTGASDFFIDEETAAKLNVFKLSVNTGKYAGGIEVETGTGMADSLSLNGVTIKNVPVIIASIKQFSGLYNGIEIDGIVSTGILKQFLATMDYPNSRLILRPRNEQGNTLLKQYLSEYNIMDEMSFNLTGTHFMTVKGSINGRKSLNFFVDSGLADEKSGLILLEQTMNFTGIPMPKTSKGPQDGGGLGGNDFEVGEFIVKEFGLGKLPVEKNIWALYGILESEFNYEEANGFLIDGLVSHNFLKKYSWTIDFDNMKMIFAR
jgi:hypothetical protein